MKNLYNLLKDYVDEEFYTVPYGTVTLQSCIDNIIKIQTENSEIIILDEFGRIDSNGECILFPNKLKSWNNFGELQNKDLIYFYNKNESIRHIGFYCEETGYIYLGNKKADTSEMNFENLVIIPVEAPDYEYLMRILNLEPYEPI